MSDLFLLSKAQMARISPHCPLSHGVPRVDDSRVVSGIVYMIRNGLQWKDAPKAYGPRKTLYNRFVRWSLLGVFDRIFASLAGDGPKPERIMIDATHLKAHRTAASLLKKGMFPAVSRARKAALTPDSMPLPMARESRQQAQRVALLRSVWPRLAGFVHLIHRQINQLKFRINKLLFLLQ